MPKFTNKFKKDILIRVRRFKMIVEKKTAIIISGMDISI